MVVKIFTQDDTIEVREALEFGKKLEEEGYEVEYFDADQPEAVAPMEIYDIYSYPSFVVAENDGSEIECWRGTVPLASDIKMFLQL